MAGDSKDALQADQELRQRVQNFLASRNYPGLRTLEVIVDRGRVILSGRVSSFHEKQLATSCAQRVAGVIGVCNYVEVIPLPVVVRG